MQKVRDLNLPHGEHVVFGSGPLLAHGLRDESGDVDIFVSDSIYNKLKESGWKEKPFNETDCVLTHDCYEVGTTWRYKDHHITLDELLESADYVDGIPFASLEQSLKWKKVYGRKKDMQDVKKIEAHLCSA